MKISEIEAIPIASLFITLPDSSFIDHKIIANRTIIKVTRNHSLSVLRGAVAAQVIDWMAEIGVAKINDTGQFASCRIDKSMFWAWVGV